MGNKKVKPLTIGEKLKFYRTRIHNSQLDLEVAAGLSVGTVSRIENGHIEPKLETVMKIAEALALTNKETAFLLGINLYETGISSLIRNQTTQHGTSH